MKTFILPIAVTLNNSSDFALKPVVVLTHASSDVKWWYESFVRPTYTAQSSSSGDYEEYSTLYDFLDSARYFNDY